MVDKILERIVVEAINCPLDDNALLFDHQFEFRSSRSTSDLLMLLSRDWQDSMDNTIGTLVITFDIVGAFDQVSQAGLLKKLCTKGIQGHLMLTSNYLQERTLHIVVKGPPSRDLSSSVIYNGTSPLEPVHRRPPQEPANSLYLR